MKAESNRLCQKGAAAAAPIKGMECLTVVVDALNAEEVSTLAQLFFNAQ